MPFTTKLTALHAALADADLGEGSGHPQVGCYAKELRTVPLTTGRLLSDDVSRRHPSPKTRSRRS